MDASGEQSAEDLYEHAPCGYLSAAPGGELVRVNETFLRWTGYTREELVGVKRFQDLLTPGGRIYHETHYAPLLRMQGNVREIAVDIVCADRRRLPVLINSVLLKDAAGEPRMVRTTLFDATERKSYERELLAARDRERVAREQVELLQRITAALAAATDAAAITAAVTTELMAAFDAQRVAVQGEFEPGLEFDDEAGAARLALEAAPNARAGVLRVELAEPRPFQSDEREFLIAVARQTALALERARLHEETRDIAHTLQQSLIAGAPPEDPRYAITTLYQPAIKYLEVGGDWHDAFELPGGKVGIVVGDVVGRGLPAASAMGQLRSAVRALAGVGLGPEAVVRHLDTFVEQVEAAQYATLAYAEVDPAVGEVVLAAAGHLPPVLLSTEPELYMGGRSTPLGIPSLAAPRIEATFTLARGEGFVLYTDGLVERRGESLDVGLDRLLAATRERPDADPEYLVEALVDHGAGDDDVCVLVFHYHGTVPSSST